MVPARISVVSISWHVAYLDTCTAMAARTHLAQVCWCHVHYDEAFSSLREASCKSFCRLHIGPDGTLRVYTLALDEVPHRWAGRGRAGAL